MIDPSGNQGPCIHGQYGWCWQCSNMGPVYYPSHQPVASPYHWPAPMGCICPAGANKDCEAPLCPRRNPAKASIGAIGNDIAIPPTT